MFKEIAGKAAAQLAKGVAANLYGRAVKSISSKVVDKVFEKTPSSDRFFRSMLSGLLMESDSEVDEFTKKAVQAILERNPTEHTCWGFLSNLPHSSDDMCSPFIKKKYSVKGYKEPKKKEI